MGSFVRGQSAVISSKIEDLIQQKQPAAKILGLADQGRCCARQGIATFTRQKSMSGRF